MFRKTLSMLFLCLFLTTGLHANQDSDIYLYIDNFDASGNNVTFDIMIDAKVDVYGAQFDIMSGDGEYNDEDDCECDQGEVPDGCTECYFDFGGDQLKSTYERDGLGGNYWTQNNACYDLGPLAESSDDEQVTGECSNQQYTSNGTEVEWYERCEYLGECQLSSGVVKTSYDYDCFIFGITDESTYPTCTVSLSEIDVDDDVDGLIDACESQHEICNNLGQDPAGNTCDSSLEVGDAGYVADCGNIGATFVNWTEGRCEDELGSCNGTLSGDECGCVWDGDNWVSAGSWYPESLWTSYSLPEVCQESSDNTGQPYEWRHSDYDPSNDDYLLDPATMTETEKNSPEGNYQYCIVPGAQDGDEGIKPIYGTGTAEDEPYNEYSGTDDDGDCGLSTTDPCEHSMAGHCVDENGDPAEPFCIGIGGGSEDTTEGVILDWSENCCQSTAGALWVDPYRDYEVCTQAESGNVNYSGVNSGWSWINYETKDICEDNKGIWIGSSAGTEGNEQYDSGERFVDTDNQIDITSADGSHLPGADFFTTITQLGVNPEIGNTGDRVVIINVTGSPIVVADENNSQLLISVVANKDVDPGTIATIMSKQICERGDVNCASGLVFSDANADPISSIYFEPYIWDTSESAGGIVASGDGTCSSYAGETDDPTCSSFCGDGVCGSGESFDGCAADCESALNDGFCDLYDGETFAVTTDCIETGCGDNVCSDDVADNETSITCPSDCPSVCGNGTCDDGESGSNCNQDCGVTCGNSVCDVEEGENFTNCESDCSTFDGDNYYHHAGLGGVEDENSLDYQLVCGDGFYHYEGLTVNGIETDQNNAEDGDCQDYVITCADGIYHYLGFTINDIVADENTAETNICALLECQDQGDIDLDGDLTECYDYAKPSNSTPIFNDGVCDCGDSSCGDYSLSSENPSNEAACINICGDGYYFYSTIGGSENGANCVEDYRPTAGDGVCDGSSGTGESPVDGNGEYIGIEPACADACGDGFCNVVEYDADGDPIYEECDADCVGISGDNVCARWTFAADDDGVISALETAYSEPGDCTYEDNNNAHGVCGNGLCDDGSEGTNAWGESAGISTSPGSGKCPEDCAVCDNTLPNPECTDGEDDPDNSWYCYTDCFTCTYIALPSFPNDGCQSEHGHESGDPNSGNFCMDCWEGCGDGTCEGPENEINCPIEGDFTIASPLDEDPNEDPDNNEDEDGFMDPPYGEFVPEENTGDCWDPALSSSSEELPTQYYLSGSYPNPFNPVTTINYSVKIAGNVRIDIYNILGQHVYTLVDAYRVPGVLYEVTWNSDYQSNVPISSGVYFYRMASGRFEEEGRMTIVK